MNRKTLKAEERKVSGRKVKNLRNQGYLPGNVYGKKIKSVSVKVDLKDFEAVYKEVGETGLVDLEVGKEIRPVLIHGIQVNPKTDKPLHVDFLQVDLKAKVSAEVPVELIGESPAEKQGIGTVVQQINEIEVEALPTDLPDKFEIDISILAEVDQAIYVKDLKIDREKIELKVDLESIIVKVEPPQKEEVTPPPAPAEGETAAPGVAPAEGETPVEGKPEESPKEEQKQ